MPSQILESIARTKRGRRRTKPLIQCSVCGEYNAVAYYTRGHGKLYMRYIHPDKVVNVKYHKLKNGKKARRLIFKRCYVGEVSEGLPLANENEKTIAPLQQDEPAKEQKPKPKPKAKARANYKEMYIAAQKEIEQYKDIQAILISRLGKFQAIGIAEE